MYGIHVRRTCTTYIYGRDLILLWPRPIFRGCHGGQTGNVSCRRREARVGREWSRDWLKERQSEKGMEEFFVTELAGRVEWQQRYIHAH